METESPTVNNDVPEYILNGEVIIGQQLIDYMTLILAYDNPVMRKVDKLDFIYTVRNLLDRNEEEILSHNSRFQIREE